MKIGILQTGIIPTELSEKFSEYPEMFERFLDGYGFEFGAYAVVSNEFPKSVAECDGWLITGSRHGVYEDHPWIPPLEQFIRDAYSQKIPVAGVCFGHQIMAQALGGKAEYFGGKWGVGTVEYTLADGSKTNLLAMHRDQVIVCPPDANVTATAEDCKIAMLEYNGPALSVQPHPEFSPEFVEELIHARAGTVIPMDQAEPALKGLNRQHDRKTYADMFAQFFLNSAKEKAA